MLSEFKQTTDGAILMDGSGVADKLQAKIANKLAQSPNSK